MTKYWEWAPQQDRNTALIIEAASALKQGKVVAFPTETVYGLGADARSDQAVARIFEAKGRPSDNPLIVHIAEPTQLEELVTEVNPTAQRLIDTFWPGPLTIIFPVKKGAVSDLVTAGLSTVAIRIPDHPIALQLIQASGCPLAAPSANRSGRPSPTMAEHVKEDLDGLIAGIVDGGPTGIGVESTVVELTEKGVQILRPGGLTVAQLQEVVEEVTIDPALSEVAFSYHQPKSPGMKYRHYAPTGTLTIIKGDDAEQVLAWMQQHVHEAKLIGEKTGVLTFDAHAEEVQADLVLSYGSFEEPQFIASQLYAALRRFDEAQVTYILAEACSEEGLGFAVMNRLLKAAGHRLVQI